MKISLLSLVWYLFIVLSYNRYLPRGSNGNTLCITSTGNIFIARWVIPLVTIPFLDYVMIQWNSFTETLQNLFINMQQISHRKHGGSVHVDYMPQTLKLEAICATYTTISISFFSDDIQWNKRTDLFCYLFFRKQNIKTFHFVVKGILVNVCVSFMYVLSKTMLDLNRVSLNCVAFCAA